MIKQNQKNYCYYYLKNNIKTLIDVLICIKMKMENYIMCITFYN